MLGRESFTFLRNTIEWMSVAWKKRERKNSITRLVSLKELGERFVAFEERVLEFVILKEKKIFALDLSGVL